MKKYYYFVLLAISIVLLTGCAEFNEPITESSAGYWNTWIVWPIVQIIHYLSVITGSYGGGIIAVTVFIRLLILPLTLKQIKHSQKMQDIQPKLKILQTKYQAKDANTQQQYQQELMRTMKESNVNPVSGCLPSIIQMPILIGLYHAISRMNVTPSYEIGSFLMIPLASPSVILAVIAGIAQFIVLKTSPTLTANSQIVAVQYILPLMIFGFGLMSPAAIALYWIISSTITIIQNKILYRERKKTLIVK
ncbi:membrane protein insertase YidC [Lysinibacillus piscis]|uniref:Membrane protein insertase YidC 2 n=1 Tax=Lysinibacillus piscis TaxID=2518931 RepID=A0ABQ5NIN9_9BACI|nr:membrane protein insertase YidC [Lysinibacillus sp. KH24]GLC87963.1 membrane protein insertase YidC 2 [Lysinibacillus sp. KH24]